MITMITSHSLGQPLSQTETFRLATFLASVILGKLKEGLVDLVRPGEVLRQSALTVYILYSCRRPQKCVKILFDGSETLY